MPKNRVDAGVRLVFRDLTSVLDQMEDGGQPRKINSRCIALLLLRAHDRIVKKSTETLAIIDRVFLKGRTSTY